MTYATSILTFTESGGSNTHFYGTGDDCPGILQLMDRYASVPMSFADACLVQMSEMWPECTVFTTDSDFRIYRRHRRQVIPLLIPADLP